MPPDDIAARFISERDVKAIAIHKVFEVAAVSLHHHHREFRAALGDVGFEIIEKEPG